MTVMEEMETRLRAAFAPQRLEIVNESARHAGHSGDDGTGETHFRITLRAETLAPLTRVARHRAVNVALGDLTHRVHSIALDVG